MFYCRLLCATIFTILGSSSVVLSQNTNTLDCTKTVHVDAADYDFSSLTSDQSVENTVENPPTKNIFQLRFNVCQDLSRQDNLPESDQCPTGTRACLTTVNRKDGTDDRITTVIPVAQASQLNPEFATLLSSPGISIQLHGPSYPPNASPAAPQSLNLTLLCSQDDSGSPTFSGYAYGVVSVEWKTKSGCAVKSKGDDENAGDDGGKVEEPSSNGGSSIGWFFLVLLIAFVSYFALGAYYNYNNFGATGWDLIPHRDFWRDVPYLFRDFVDHLCTTLRPGHKGSRRGYMAV